MLVVYWFSSDSTDSLYWLSADVHWFRNDSLLICTDLLLNSTDSLLPSTSKTLLILLPTPIDSLQLLLTLYWLLLTVLTTTATTTPLTKQAKHKIVKNMNVNNMVITQCSQLLSSEHKWNTKWATNIYWANTNVLGSDINVRTLDWIQLDRFSLTTKMNFW